MDYPGEIMADHKSQIFKISHLLYFPLLDSPESVVYSRSHNSFSVSGKNFQYFTLPAINGGDSGRLDMKSGFASV